jgi:hypothetical protein
MIRTYFLTGLGLVMASVVLLISCLNQELGVHFEGRLGLSAVLIYLSGLLLLIIDSLRQFRSKRYYHGSVALLAAIFLYCCSFLPIYGYHIGEPGEPGGGYHRHSIWALGHVH